MRSLLHKTLRVTYDTKQSDGEVSVMPEFREMRSTPSLQSVPGPRYPGEVALVTVLSVNQMKLFDI